MYGKIRTVRYIGIIRFSQLKKIISCPVFKASVGIGPSQSKQALIQEARYFKAQAEICASDFDKINFYLQAIECLKATKEKTLLLANLNNKIGTIYFNQNRFSEAFEFLTTDSKIYIKFPNQYETTVSVLQKSVFSALELNGLDAAAYLLNVTFKAKDLTFNASLMPEDFLFRSTRTHDEPLRLDTLYSSWLVTDSDRESLWLLGSFLKMRSKPELAALFFEKASNPFTLNTIEIEDEYTHLI